MHPRNIITVSYRILLNPMGLLNSSVICMIGILVKIQSDLVLEGHQCILRSCYLIELHHSIRDRILCITLILLRSSFRSQ